MKRATIIFDNAGGTTLKLYQGDKVYCNHYMHSKQAAKDYYLFMNDDNISVDDCDGHDEELEGFEPEYQDIRNGGYRLLYDDDIEKELAKEEEEHLSWFNQHNFIQELRKLSQN
jgi:hypothetical protein